MNKYIKYLIEGFFDDIENDILSNNLDNAESFYDYTFRYTTNDKTLDIYQCDNMNIIKNIKHVLYDYPNLNNYLKCIESPNVENYYTVPKNTKFLSFCDNKKLKTLEFDEINTSNYISMVGMFDGCTSLKTLDLSKFNTSNVQFFNAMFENTKKLKQINLSSFNTSNASEMSFMFHNCVSIDLLDLSSFNTNNVTNMMGMFSGCTSLKNIDLSNFKTKKAVNLEMIFRDCNLLETVNLSNITKCDNFMSMFMGCTSLKNVQFSKSNIRGVTHTYGMFKNCESIEIIDLSTVNSKKIINVAEMFSGCISLKKLDLSNFQYLDHVGDQKRNMFKDCKSLKYIKCTKGFRDWCWENAKTIDLPRRMYQNKSGIWDIVD